MKKALVIVLSLVLLVAVFAGCGKRSPQSQEAKTIKVGASVTLTPRSSLWAKEVLAKENINLEIVEFADYVQRTPLWKAGIWMQLFPAPALSHHFNADNGTHLVSVASIHYEPFGIYAGKQIP
jgi:D-methionine transport system substrate-binding protein